MAFSVKEFSAKINRLDGLAKNNLFATSIALPQTLSYLSEIMPTNTLPFLCKSVNVPPMQLETMEFRPYGYGKLVSRPTGMARHQLDTIFMVDTRFGAVKFFHRWMQSIINYNAGGSGRGIGTDPQGKLKYELEYKQNYASTITVYLYGHHGATVDSGTVYRYTFNGAYPSSVGSLDMAWENDGQVMTIPITFEYDSVYVDAIEIAPVTTNNSRDRGLLTYLSSIQGFAQLIQSVDRPDNIQDLVNQLNTLDLIMK